MEQNIGITEDVKHPEAPEPRNHAKRIRAQAQAASTSSQQLTAASQPDNAPYP
jgi:hypothetical protein